MPPLPPPPPRPHSLAEDGYAIAIGCAFIAMGLMLLKQANLVTGGMAGIALLLSYLIPYPPAALFLAINIPFFLFAGRAMGVAFGLKTLFANIAILALGLAMPMALEVARVSPFFAALFGGSIIGFGILAIARHGAGVGGLGVVALILQTRRGWNAGRTQMAGDAVILLASLPLLSLNRFGLSILSAAAINAVLIVNHRPGRYIGH
ncbi:YitT family protein [Sphingobium ummariense]|uniref:Membrane protein n=1 Tax=Sphingobium ummariense RL-3 TaxID=1346791 RepID=T0J2J3_9SPHN|nr:YitT family protein [Sphingobium ummariense]EQB32166.1 membrane protein [Sphingobium ummariense RL-3]